MGNAFLNAKARRGVAMIGVAGAAVLGSALTLAPAAMADDTVDDPDTSTEPPTPPETPADPPVDDPDDESPEPAEVEEPEQQKPDQRTPDKRSTEAAAAAVEPDFGYSKFRVGVQIEDGRYVPDGVTTLGSQITITEAGPGVPGGEVSVTCTTTLPDEDDPTTTFCENLTPGSLSDDFVTPTFGDTVTITQTTVNDGLRIIDGTKVDVPDCDLDDSPFCAVNRGDILLTDAPLPPEAADDDPCADPGEPVDVDVLANDDTHGAPLTDLTITTDPSRGSATVIGAGDDRTVRYTPDDDFSGNDSFDYQITTANGTATATVVFTACSPPTTPPPENGVLPDTGGADPRILGTGLALVVGGGALVTAGGRKRRELGVVS